MGRQRTITLGEDARKALNLKDSKTPVVLSQDVALACRKHVVDKMFGLEPLGSLRSRLYKYHLMMFTSPIALRRSVVR